MTLVFKCTMCSRTLSGFTSDYLQGPILNNLPNVIYHLTIDETNGDVEIYVLVVSAGCERPSCQVSSVYPDGVFWVTGMTVHVFQ